MVPTIPADPLGVFLDISQDFLGVRDPDGLCPDFKHQFCAIQKAWGSRRARFCQSLFRSHVGAPSQCRHPLCPSCWCRREHRIRESLLGAPGTPGVLRTTSVLPLQAWGTPGARALFEAFRARAVRSLSPVVWALEVIEDPQGILDIGVNPQWYPEPHFRYRGLFLDSGAPRRAERDSETPGCPKHTLVSDPLGISGPHSVWSTEAITGGPMGLLAWRHEIPTPVRILREPRYRDAALDLKNTGSRRQFFITNGFKKTHSISP